MKYLAPVLIILILVLGALIALRMHRTADRRRKDWNALSKRATFAEIAIHKISKEIDTAKTAGMSLDVLVLDSILEDYDVALTNSNVKGISR